MGLIPLVAVIVAVGVYAVYDGTRVAAVTLRGYIDGEKIGLVDDPKFAEILKKRFNTTFTYQKAGSLDMIGLDHTGRDYLWPSSQTALDLYEMRHGKPKRSEIIFNTPIVLYTRRMVADALITNGYVTEQNGTYFLDMAKFLPALESGMHWSDLGLDLYGTVVVFTTDPTKSNSGNMFAGRLANMINGGNVVTQQTVDAVLPKLTVIYRCLGYAESSRADLFSQFLKTGVGAKPLAAGYESQLIEFSNTNPGDYAQLKDDVIMMYPVPTVWSSHVLLGLSDQGAKALDVLMDKEIQTLAWEKHGFRTGINSANVDTSGLKVAGVSPVISRIIQMPDSQVMQRLIDAPQ